MSPLIQKGFISESSKSHAYHQKERSNTQSMKWSRSISKKRRWLGYIVRLGFHNLGKESLKTDVDLKEKGVIVSTRKILSVSELKKNLQIKCEEIMKCEFSIPFANYRLFLNDTYFENDDMVDFTKDSINSGVYLLLKPRGLSTDDINEGLIKPCATH